MVRISRGEVIAAVIAAIAIGAVSCAKTETLEISGGLVAPALVDLEDCAIELACEVSIELLNTSDRRLEFGEVEFDEQFDEPFYAFSLRGMPRSIEANASVPLRVLFKAHVAMSEPVTSTVRFNSTAGPASMTVRARGVHALSIEPVLVDFGFVPRGSAAEREVVIRNSSPQPITVRRLSPSPPSPGGGRFEQLTVLDAPVPPNGSINVIVRYTPYLDSVAVVPDRTEWIFAYCDVRERCEVKVELIGVRGDPVPSCLEADPANVDFGVVGIGEVGESTVLLHNGCDRRVTIREINADSAATGAFSANRSALSINAGAFAAIRVVFSPHGNIEFNSSLVIVSDDQGAPELRVPLYGVGVIGQRCELVVHGPAINFGEVEIMRTQTAAVVIENVGSADCLLGRITLDGAERDKFQIVAETSTLAAGEVGFIEVSYTPTDHASDNASLMFARPVVTVPLSGTGSADTPVVYPDRIDFGAIGQGCTSLDRVMHIFNHRDTPLVIDRITIGSGSSPDLAFTGLVPPLPLELAPFTQYRLELDYTPQQVRLDSAVVQIYELGHAEPYTAWLLGRDGSRIEERFTQPARPAIDVVVVIDPALPMPLQDFLLLADASGADYQIATATITSEHFRSALRELRAPRLLGPTAGIIRRDAALAMVFVADVDDSSPGEVRRYADDFLRIHGARNKNMFSTHMVTGGLNGCVAPGITAEAAYRFLEMSLVGPGAYESICADWADVLASLATGIFGPRSVFTLENAPAKGTIEVFIDGVPAPRGTWSTSDFTNDIFFTPDGTPPPGAEITIAYSNVCL